MFKKLSYGLSFLILAVAFWPALNPPIRGQNQVLGQVDFDAKNKAEKTAGVWIDGQYVGYVQELKGDKKVLLLPGEHEVSVRQTGYLDLTQKIIVEPNKLLTLMIVLQRDPNAQYSKVTSEIKLKVTPDRAAVFVDGNYAGTVHEFDGVGKAMLVAPGKHHVKIALTGFQAFDTDIDVLPRQKVVVKTDLMPGSVQQADPSVKN
jgi:PEGA domain